MTDGRENISLQVPDGPIARRRPKPDHDLMNLAMILDQAGLIARLCRVLAVLTVVFGIVSAVGLEERAAGASATRLDATPHSLEALATGPVLRLSVVAKDLPEPVPATSSVLPGTAAYAPAAVEGAPQEDVGKALRPVPRRPASQGPPVLA